MIESRILRHASLFIVFSLACIIGFFRPYSHSGVSPYNDAVTEEQQEHITLGRLVYYDYWKKKPLALDRSIYPHVTEMFRRQYLDQQTVPQLQDVLDSRLFSTNDFFEGQQIIRVPGARGSMASRLIRNQMWREHQVARIEALETRGKMRWSSTAQIEIDKPSIALASLGRKVLEVRDAEGFRSDSTEYLGAFAIWEREEILATSDVHIAPYPMIFTSSHEGNSSSSSLDQAPLGQRRRPTHGWDHFYIAINLYYNEKVLRHFVALMTQYLEEEIAPFFNITASVVVSIYGSISGDRTAKRIRAQLIPQLNRVGVRTIFVTTEGSCLGRSQREIYHERIEWMACVRNKVMEPLYEYGMDVFQGESTASADGLVVLFFNDILFRPADITLLLESRVEAQIAKETRPDGWQKPAPPPSPSSSSGTAPGDTPSSKGTTFDMACGIDYYNTFYDIWVTRDRLGNPALAQMPYTTDQPTQDAIYRILKTEKNRGKEGFVPNAVPVKSCWNGIAAIRGRFFLPPTPSRRKGFPPEGQHPGQRQPGMKQTSTSSADVTTEAPIPVVEVNNLRSEEVKWTYEPIEDGDKHRPPSAVPPHSSIRRLSGAIYDHVGNMSTLMAKGLYEQYVRLLVRRLYFYRDLWSSTRHEIATMTGHPYYHRENYENSSSACKLLATVLAEENNPSTSLRRQIEDNMKLLNLTATTKNGKTAKASPTWDLVEDDSEYYVVRHPAVRFRHSLTPSYGAMVFGRRPVQDSACLSSECLLICQDIMQAAMLQDGRAPVILLNPLVRVAYEIENFAVLNSSTSIYRSATLYRLFTYAHRLKTWFSTLWIDGSAEDSLDKAPDGGDLSKSISTSAVDDWLSKEDGEAEASLLLNVVNAYGQFEYAGYVNVTQLTLMICTPLPTSQLSGSMGAFYCICRIGQLLLVAFLLRTLFWATQRQIERRVSALLTENGTKLPHSGGEDKLPGMALLLSEETAESPIRQSLLYSLAPEERWWITTYRLVWRSHLYQLLHQFISLLFSYAYGPIGTGSGSGSEGGFGFRRQWRCLLRNGGGETYTTPMRKALRSFVRLFQRCRRTRFGRLAGTVVRYLDLLFRSVLRALMLLLCYLLCLPFWFNVRPMRPLFSLQYSLTSRRRKNASSPFFDGAEVVEIPTHYSPSCDPPDRLEWAAYEMPDGVPTYNTEVPQGITHESRPGSRDDSRCTESLTVAEMQHGDILFQAPKLFHSVTMQPGTAVNAPRDSEGSFLRLPLTNYGDGIGMHASDASNGSGHVPVSRSGARILRLRTPQHAQSTEINALSGFNTNASPSVSSKLYNENEMNASDV